MKRDVVARPTRVVGHRFQRLLSGLAALALCVAAAWAFLGGSFSDASSGTGAQLQVDVQVLDGSNARSDAGLEASSRVELGRGTTDATRAPPVDNFESRGNLNERDRSRVRRMVDPQGNARALLVAQSKAESSGSLKDYANFLMERAITEKMRAASQLLANDAYVVLPAFTELPTIPEGCLVFTLPAFRRTDPAETCDVVFFMKREDFPVLASAWDACLAAQSDMHDDECRTFNEMPQPQRAAAITAHEEALAAISAAEVKLSPALDAQRKALIPGRIFIDHRWSLLSVRPLTYR